jgi:hypothetical protein
MQKLIIPFLLLASVAVKAQTEDEKVASAVLDYVEGFYFGDTARIIRSISPEVVKYGYYKQKDATAYSGEPMSFREMLDYCISVKKRNSPNADKLPKTIKVYDVQDQTASAKLTAWWGTDYILLAKLNGKWMITHVLWQSPPVATK